MRSVPPLVTLALTLALAGATEIQAGSCVSAPDTLCLRGDRFSVEVDWDDYDGATGRGQVMPFVVADSTGFLYFEDSRYLELMIEVLDGCAINSRFWVSLVGLSDYVQTVTVTDTASGVVKTYLHPQGEFFPVITDTDAFSTCDFPAPRGRERSWRLKGPALPLVGGRFSLEAQWRDFAGDTGPGQPMALTSHSGYFWFFTSSNPELAVKLFDGSAVNGYFWVTCGATTDLEYTLWVTDLLCQDTRTYLNPLGSPGDTVEDKISFPDDCAPIFADGFESGDLTVWSHSVP